MKWRQRALKIFCVCTWAFLTADVKHKFEWLSKLGHTVEALLPTVAIWVVPLSLPARSTLYDGGSILGATTRLDGLPSFVQNSVNDITNENRTWLLFVEQFDCMYACSHAWLHDCVRNQFRKTLGCNIYVWHPYWKTSYDVYAPHPIISYEDIRDFSIGIASEKKHKETHKLKYMFAWKQITLFTPVSLLYLTVRHMPRRRGRTSPITRQCTRVWKYL